MKELIRDFLRKLPSQYGGLEAIIFFGSFVGHEKYRDVDVILIFKSPSDVLVTREIARQFRQRFSKSLHTQLFLSADTKNIKQFLKKADRWELVYGKRFTSKHKLVLPDKNERA